jgi:hypothetical protein
MLTQTTDRLDIHRACLYRLNAIGLMSPLRSWEEARIRSGIVREGGSGPLIWVRRRHGSLSADHSCCLLDPDLLGDTRRVNPIHGSSL